MTVPRILMRPSSDAFCEPYRRAHRIGYDIGHSHGGCNHGQALHIDSFISGYNCGNWGNWGMGGLWGGGYCYPRSNFWSNFACGMFGAAVGYNLVSSIFNGNNNTRCCGGFNPYWC